MNSDLFQTIEPDPPIELFDPQEAQQRDYELKQFEETEALRECLTKGVSMRNLRVLCSATGIPLSHVCGG